MAIGQDQLGGHLLAALLRLQQMHGWTNAQMADELHIPASYWSMIRNRRRDMPFPVSLRAMHRFPGLIDEHTKDVKELSATMPSRRQTA